MITMPMRTNDRSEVLVLVVLEPDQLTRLRAGKQIEIDLNTLLLQHLKFKVGLVLGFSPDVEWVRAEFGRRQLTHGGEVEQLLRESMDRPEVTGRKPHPTQLVYDELQNKGKPQ